MVDKIMSKKFNDKFEESFYNLHIRECIPGDEASNKLCGKYRSSLIRNIKSFIIEEKNNGR